MATRETTLREIEAVKGQTDRREPLGLVLRGLASGTVGPTQTVPDIAPFEEGLFNAIATSKISSEDYNRLDFEYLLDSGIEHVVRAQSLRQDGQEMGLRAANDILSRWKASKDLEISRLEVEDGFYRHELESLESYVRELQEIIAPNNGADEAETAATKLRMGQIRADLARSREMVVARKAQRDNLLLAIEVAEAYARTLGERNVGKGNALNHVERIESARQAYRQNMLEGYQRLMIVGSVLPRVFLESQARAVDATKLLVFPELHSASDEIGYTERLLAWARQTLAILDRITGYDIDYRLILSRNVFLHSIGKPIPDWEFELEVTKDHFPEMLDLRLISIAVHVVPAVVNVTDTTSFGQRYSGYRCKVQLPSQRSIDKKTLSVPDVPIGHVPPFELGAGRVASTAIRNADPVGNWRVKFVEKSPHGRTDGEKPADIYLDLVVRGSLNPR